jgi:hypothetical protein
VTWRWAAVIVIVATAACEQPKSEGDIEAIAADAARDATASRFSELESRIEQLEERDQKLSAYTKAVDDSREANDNLQDQKIKGLQAETTEIIRAYNAHLAAH